MPLLLQNRMSILYLLVLLSPSLAAQITCMKAFYGSPRSSDCEQLLYSFASDDDNRPRLFDEEQLRTDGGLGFPGVTNVYSTFVFQLPAYWSLRQSSPHIIYI